MILLQDKDGENMPEFDYSKLTLMNDFLFSTFMHKKEFCIPMLELILGVKI